MQSCQKIRTSISNAPNSGAIKLSDEAAEIFAQAARKTQGKAQEVGNLLGDLFNPDMLPAEGVSIKTGRSPLENINEPKKIVTVDSQGKPSGTRFRDDYEAHIKEREFSKASQKSGVNGTHNLKEFEQYDIIVNPTLTKDSIKILSKTPHPTVKGVYKIEYQMPKLDKTQKLTGQWRYKNGTTPFKKTVYDSTVISDTRMTQLGREAFADAVKSGKINPDKSWSGHASNGLEFFGYTDETGAVRTFFPQF